MNKIDISSWKNFHLFDIFEIDSGTKLDKVKMKTYNPTINFVGRSNENNGVTTKVDLIEDLQPYNEGYLTLALGGAYLGSCFIQKEQFYTSQNVAVLIPKENISFYAKQFIATIIFVESQLHYRAFLNELNSHIKTDFVFKLPVDKHNNPDYEYMDKYIKEKNSRLKDTFAKLSDINNTKQDKVDISQWTEFEVGSIFDIVNGKGITAKEIYEHSGNMRAIQSGEENFGCIGMIDFNYVKEQGYAYTLKPCLSVARSGSSGYVGIQTQPCVVGDSAKLLIPKLDLSIYTLIFLRAILMINKKNYSYNDKVTKERYEKDIIKLPSKDGISPDYEYMHNYISSNYNKHYNYFNILSQA